MAGAHAKTGSSSAGLRCLGLIAALAPCPAQAGAWIAPEGGQTITTEIAGQRDDVFYSESSYYFETPVASDVSFVASPWLGQDARQADDGLTWEMTVAGKLATHRGRRTAMALQGGLVWNSNPLGDCAETQAELRWLGGVSWDEGKGFANLEAGERSSGGDCHEERLDVTFGYRVQRRWLGMAQLFIDQPRLGDGSVKAQISLVRFEASGRGLQIGVRARIDGDTPEPALVLGFWGDGER